MAQTCGVAGYGGPRFHLLLAIGGMSQPAMGQQEGRSTLP